MCFKASVVPVSSPPRRENYTSQAHYCGRVNAEKTRRDLWVHSQKGKGCDVRIFQLKFQHFTTLDYNMREGGCNIFFEGVCIISHVSPFTGVRRGQSGHWQIANSAFPNFSRFYWEGASLGFHIILPLLPHSTFKYSTQIHLSTRCQPRIPHHSTLAATFYI